ncbi:MAG TPA: hypothetical protein DHU72_01155 [Rikenellaceae bacterium]|nr:hypothetical protein [Rikenellaceae bacterium]
MVYFQYFCLCMMDGKVIIREADKSDAPFVAECVLCAVGLSNFEERPETYRFMDEICTMEDTLYSYRNALIASVDGADAGCIVAYPGDSYEEDRKRTFAEIERKCEMPFDSASDMETGPGEYYLDSLAVAPGYRGCGLGHLLMRAQISRGRELGYGRFSLIVDQSRPRVSTYYGELGFRKESEIIFAGVSYDKLVLDDIVRNDRV